MSQLQCRMLQCLSLAFCPFSPLTCKPAARAFFHITLALTYMPFLTGLPLP